MIVVVRSSSFLLLKIRVTGETNYYFCSQTYSISKNSFFLNSLMKFILFSHVDSIHLHIRNITRKAVGFQQHYFYNSFPPANKQL